MFISFFGEGHMQLIPLSLTENVNLKTAHPHPYILWFYFEKGFQQKLIKLE